MAAARGPLTLRDFLELGCDSSSDGFRSYPRCLPWSDDALQAPVRLLIEADLRRSPSRSPSSLFSIARISSLSRTFSRRIKEGFSWRRHDDDDDDLFLDDRDSCGFPSPLVSSCSASDSRSEYAESEVVDMAAIGDKMACPPAFECEEKPSSSSSSTSSSADHHDCTDGAAADGKKKMQAGGDPIPTRSKLGMEEDKQQLSPVSVLDFPFDDDDADERSDAGTCSPSFHHRCPTTPPPDLLLHRPTKQAHKIRRYYGIAQAAVDPVDLEARFTTTTSESGESVGASTHLPTTTSSSCTDTTSSSATSTTTTAPRHGEEHQSVEQMISRNQEELDEYRLLAQLLVELDEDTAAAVDDVSQVLLLDFFSEGVDRLRSSSGAGSVVGATTVSRPVDDDARVAEALVGAAAEWLRGAGTQWGIRDVMLSGKAALEDMERGRRWMCAGEEEREVGAAVEGLVMDGLLDELVAELVPWCHGDGRPSKEPLVDY